MAKPENIVVTERMDLSPEQWDRLAALGTVIRYADAPTREEWSERTKGFRIVCSGKCGLSDRIGGKIGTEGVYDLDKGTLVSHPFVNTAWMDAERLKERGITVSYAPGSNRDAVAEWAMYGIIAMLRGFPEAVGKREPEPELQRTESLYGKNIAILGHGNVGTAIGERATPFGMNVKYLHRGDSLADVVRDAHVTVNCLSAKPENHGLLDHEFFLESMPNGARFVSMTSPDIYNLDAMLDALSQGRLRQAAIDIGGGSAGNIEHPNYRRLVDLRDPRILVTPQIAHYTDFSALQSYDMMIENIAAMQRGQPTHLVR